MKTIVIIDDEEDARNLLKHYISEHKNFKIIGEASDGLEAVKLVNQLKPDTLFLDIQMPGLNGFEVLTQLDEIPEIIFSTAYDQFAIKAFEVHAIDYLLKPYGKHRVENALNRILKNQEAVIPFAESLLQKETNFPTKLILHKGLRKMMVHVGDIMYAEAFGDYTKVFTKNEEFLATKGISTVIEKLNPAIFLRTHRSHFVNKNAIIELKKIDRYYYLILTNSQKLKISNSYLSDFKNLML